jgi:hypothetical protein
VNHRSKLRLVDAGKQQISKSKKHHHHHHYKSSRSDKSHNDDNDDKHISLRQLIYDSFSTRLVGELFDLYKQVESTEVKKYDAYHKTILFSFYLRSCPMVMFIFEFMMKVVYLCLITLVNIRDYADNYGADYISDIKMEAHLTAEEVMLMIMFGSGNIGIIPFLL